MYTEVGRESELIAKIDLESTSDAERLAKVIAAEAKKRS